MPMNPLSRRRALLLALTMPLFAALPGCDPNPGGPTFPTVTPEKDEDDDAGSAPGAPASSKKGRRKKKEPHAGMINDPAA